MNADTTHAALILEMQEVVAERELLLAREKGISLDTVTKHDTALEAFEAIQDVSNGQEIQA